MSSSDEMVEQARGEYSSQYITQTNSVNTPIIELLSPEEQLHFVYFHTDKGFKITEPSGEERTPDHDSLSEASGKRFLLITDKRILYIVGKLDENEDKIQEFEYDQISSVEGYKSMMFPTIEFTTTDGTTYKFVNHANESDTPENVAEYIRNQISSSDKQTHNESRQNQSGTSEEVKFCPDCGAEINVQDDFCSECGANVGDLGTATNDPPDSKSQEPNSSSQSKTASNSDSPGDTDGKETKWTLSFVIGVLMSITSGLLSLFYFLDGNIVSSICFGMGFLFANSYLNGTVNISKWLATAIFLLFWMTGSFFIGI